VLLETIREHLQLAYEYEDAAPQQAPGVDRTRLMAVREDLRRALGEALRRLDVEAIDSAIAAIAGTDRELAAALAGHASNFQYDRLLDLLPA
jgi:hypothetical protein